MCWCSLFSFCLNSLDCVGEFDRIDRVGEIRERAGDGRVDLCTCTNTARHHRFSSKTYEYCIIVACGKLHWRSVNLIGGVDDIGGFGI